MAFLEAKNLSFRYAAKDSFSLENVSFKIQKGEFILLFGETGCGKSTLLKQWKPSISPVGEKKGEMLFGGHALDKLEQRDEAWKIGYVSQNPDNQIVTDKVWHELAFTLENLGCPSDEIRKRVAEIAVYFGITGWFHKSVSQLSGGQKQILNLASVMIAKPELLLLDEPTSQLDPIATENFMNLLSRIHTELGTTILLAEHRLEEAYAKVDRCMVMEQGKLICFDKVNQVAKYLYEEKKSAFALLPLQARLPIILKQDYSIVTVGQAKHFIEENMEKVSMNIENIACEKGVSVLSFQNIWFRYEKNGLDVLRDFSLAIGKGEFLAIVGANGQGKSTILQLATGILKPYRGKVKSEVSQGISLLPQNPQDLFLKSSVKEELLTVSEDIDEIVEKLELTELLDKHPYDLSGGQQQMVGLAKVLLTRPEILLLDEPTKGVDQIRKKKLGIMLQNLNREGITIVLVSHDVDFCATYASKVGMVFDGVMTAMGERHTFFLNQYFFTTTCLKICREVYDGMIIEEEVLNYEKS